MRIVRAKAGDADRLSHVARTAKAHWGYPAEWMHAWQDFFTIRPEKIVANDYLAAQPENGPPVGFCGVHRDGVDWRLEHLWVLPDWQANGIGQSLFDAAVTLVRERGGEALSIQADPNAEGFYLRMGGVRVGEVDATMFGVPRVMPELRYAIV